ncbi:MAG: anthranilate phosphoribosyltransferase [Elusimicrobia bacterium]|nr:anthranilate phosphoribosyltransferase [Candidatus Obscuribacterium magneticum]
MIKEAIGKLIDKQDLTQKEAYAIMKEIMGGQATPSQMAGFLVALRNKGETAEEIAGCALSMRDATFPLSVESKLLVDCCGTGGDGKGGINISTAAAFVVAGAGVKVAKHGNRCISSHSGSADVLEALGIRIDPPPAITEKAIDTIGIGFLFAPSYHTSMKNVMPTRRELGIRTVFNLLGPLTNPARVQVQLIGLYDPRLLKTIALVLKVMGHKGGLVVHSDGWDEITLEGKTKVAELHKGKIFTYEWTAKDFGLPKVPNKVLRGGDPSQNAERIRNVFKGEKDSLRHVVVANAAATLWVAEKNYGSAKITLKDAVKRAEEAIDSGQALKKLETLADVSHMLG